MGGAGSTEELSARIAALDRRCRDGEAVPAEERVLDLTPVYRGRGWASGEGRAPLPQGLDRHLDLVECARDPRWSAHFAPHFTHISLYRSRDRCYWLLRYDPAARAHRLELVGTEADALTAYGP
ncbi:MAG: hypothetical protein ACFCGT_01400 [Sandaracinaceae bacterium]